MKKRLSILLVLCLLLSLCMAPVAFAAGVTVLSTQNLAVDGKTIPCEKYNIDGSNYFKLRDMAYLLNGTGSQFAVGWDAASSTVSITTGQPYTPNGTELKLDGGDKSATSVPSSQTIKIDGVVVSNLSVYNIGGNNYFKLRDLGAALGFEVGYDPTTATAILTSAEVNGIKLNKDRIWFYDGETYQLEASVLPSNTGTKAVTWTTSNPAVCTVSSAGLVTMVAPGRATVTAKNSKGHTASCEVNVVAVASTGIALNKQSLWQYAGDTYQLEATVAPANASYTNVEWSSANPAVATVSSTGLVTMVAPGKTIVTAKNADGKTANCEVNVMWVSATGLSLNMTTATKNVGEKLQLSAKITPENASNKVVAWSSSNDKVATVDHTGMVTIVGRGTATIQAKLGDFTASCAVKGKAQIISADYAYYADFDFRTQVKTKYDSAKANYGYVYAYENIDGQLCVLTMVNYKIISNYWLWTLHNLDTGERIEAPDKYYDKMIDYYGGAKAQHYYDILDEVLGNYLLMLEGVKSVLETGVNTRPGVYISSATLNK